MCCVLWRKVYMAPFKRGTIFSFNKHPNTIKIPWRIKYPPAIVPPNGKVQVLTAIGGGKGYRADLEVVGLG